MAQQILFFPNRARESGFPGRWRGNHDGDGTVTKNRQKLRYSGTIRPDKRIDSQHWWDILAALAEGPLCDLALLHGRFSRVMRVAYSLRPFSWIGLALLPLVAGSARAELGGAMKGVQADRAQMKAQLVSVPRSTHTVHEMTLPNGAGVKEFTNTRGQVYAVTWSGPGKPDLRSLLGGYFTSFQADNARLSPRSRRRPAAIHRSDLVIQTGGHMGYFWGVAYIPLLVPADFSVSDLQ